MTDLLIPFSLTEVSELLQNVVNGIVQESRFDQTASKSNVNWRFLTTLISVLIIYFENSSVYIKSVVEKLIVTSLDAEKYGQDSFETAMIIVRQACQESKTGSFQTYGLWFSQTFGDETTTLTANSKKKITNLVQYLTNMVPYENAACLRAQLARPPWLPSNYREIWNDYSTLARTRLSDLNTHRNLDWHCSDQPIFNSIKSNNDMSEESLCKRSKIDDHGDKNPVLSDVEKALNSFEINKKMPQLVLEASIFRRPYFVGQFLPALLKLTTTRIKSNQKAQKIQLLKDFVQCLQAKGKIPSQIMSHFEKYIS